MRLLETRLGGGAVEIGVRTAEGELVAVVTHPCRGAPWFLHRAGRSHCQRERFRTRRDALAAASAAAQAEGRA
jgi:hypothetical protein